MINNRFKTGFPNAYVLFRTPLLTLILFYLLALVTSVYSLHFTFASILLFYIFFCYYLESKHLNYLLITPLTVIAIAEFIRIGVGVSMYVLGDESSFNPELAAMQVAELIGLPFLALGYCLLTSKIPAFSLSSFKEDELVSNQLRIEKLLVIIGWFFLLGALLSIVIGVATGSLDRAASDPFAAIASEKVDINPSTIVTILGGFALFTTFGFTILPLIFRNSYGITRILLVFCIFSYFILALATGSRGLIIFPLLYLGNGLWLWGGSAKKLKIGFLIAIMMALFLIPAMDSYRNSRLFRSTSLGNVWERMQAYGEVETKDSLGLEGLKVTGAALIGTLNDTLIYEKTPNSIPHAGWENISNVFFFWLPRTIAPWKPQLLDGNDIVIHYLDGYFSGGFATISFNADMYRRFGWIGVAIGNFCFGLFYGMVIKYFFKIYHSTSPALGLLFMIYTFNFIQRLPQSTLLSTFWMWLWEVPKHLLIIYVIYLIAERQLTKKFVVGLYK
jgi:hypothetical protein